MAMGKRMMNGLTHGYHSHSMVAGGFPEMS